jgi:hypothetical protein
MWLRPDDHWQENVHSVPTLISPGVFRPQGCEPLPPLERTQQVGDRGETVRVIQEWLCLQHLPLKIDRIFGPATAARTREFQTATAALAVTGSVDERTYDLLRRPMTNALGLINVPGAADSKISDLVVKYARQHLEQRAREVGGQNRGPWVRLYLHGHEREPDSPQRVASWCAGFVSTIIQQASATLDLAPPMAYRWNCEHLAREAAERHEFVCGDDARRDPTRIPPGSLLLLRDHSNRWHHTGIVVRADDQSVQTIEGNAHHEGDPLHYGHEVTTMCRSWGRLDFVVLHH